MQAITSALPSADGSTLWIFMLRAHPPHERIELLAALSRGRIAGPIICVLSVAGSDLPAVRAAKSTNTRHSPPPVQTRMQLRTVIPSENCHALGINMFVISDGSLTCGQPNLDFGEIHGHQISCGSME
ncbi:hypothetical protein [Neomesorhizobium albiziae]|uniref:hypothetical protein n=1 Tax=Neomesorhizobium albiziae TaxID=335020 RepID=UPI0024E10ECE|nr:hypothetical protein [Mesorhizobium albiziae]